MVQINRPADQEFLTNSEKLDWLKHYKYNNKLLPIASHIYNLWLYRKIVKTLCQEDQYSLGLYIKEYGFSKGIDICIMNIRHCLSWRRHLKNLEMEREISISSCQVEKVQKEIDEKLEEAQHEQGLTQDEVNLRNKPYPGGMMKVPEEIIFQQPLVEQGHDGDVTYLIFNKIYGCWAATVTSTHREKPDGKKGCVILRDTTLKNLKEFLKTEIIKEKIRQEDFMKKINKRPNIQRIQRVMGIDGESNLNNNDIF